MKYVLPYRLRMKSTTAKQLIKILLAHGFVMVRQSGSHAIYKNKELGRMVPVPIHGRNRIIPIGTFLNIVKQSGIDTKYFVKKNKK